MPDDRFTLRGGASHAPDRTAGALVGALLNDFSDLVRKEIALGSAEMSRNVAAKVTGSAWFAVAGVFVLVAVLTAVAGLVFLSASFGLALHWSAFIVAGVLALIGAIMLFAGKSRMSGETLPQRAMAQVKQDVQVVKEQMK